MSITTPSVPSRASERRIHDVAEVTEMVARVGPIIVAEKRKRSRMSRMNAHVRQREHSIIGKVLFALCKAVDTPVSLRVWLCYKHSQFQEMQRTIDPLDYCSAATFQIDYYVTEFLSKYIFEGGVTNEELEAEAMRRFDTAEYLCQKTNELLTLYAEGKVSPTSRAVHQVFHLASRKICELLSEFNPFDGFDSCKWGPGSTASLSSIEATRTNKVREDRISVTDTASGYIKTVLTFDPFWLEARGFSCDGPTTPLNLNDHIVINQFSKMAFVAKNAKTHRIIGAEPTANVFLQLGIAQVLRKALRKVGVDLDDQSINQHAAYKASICGLSVTVDESMASDLVSRVLVEQLLPPDWYRVLADLRTPYYRFPTRHSRSGEFEKWSSMGNGYTFELESLIFWAIAQSCIEISGAKGRAKVYGDDIVLPHRAYDLLLQTFNFTGFLVNHEKTHTMGHFRESCGKHFFAGFDVTPVYQRSAVKDLPSLIALHNKLHRLCERLEGIEYPRHKTVMRAPWFEPRVNRVRAPSIWAFEIRPAVMACRSILTGMFAQFGVVLLIPYGTEGDAGMLCPRSTFIGCLRRQKGVYQHQTVVAMPEYVEANEAALWALSMRFGPSGSDPSGFESRRPKVLYHRISWTTYYL